MSSLVTAILQVVLFWIPWTEAGYDSDMLQAAIKKILLSLALILASFAARAEGYHVEIVIFENLNPSTDGEISQTVLQSPDFSNSIELAGGEEAGNSFKLLSSGFYKLGGIDNQLKSSGKYRPLLHMAWQQPALYGDNARSVHILKSDGGDPGSAGGSPLKIDGTIRIRASQFLHADVDLVYFIDPRSQSVVNTAAPGAPAQPASSRMRESRRMKLNELHYFDHPLFGMIMHISRAGSE